MQITDTHFGKPEHAERTRKAVETINKLPFDVQFVAVTGDIMSDNITDESAVAEAVAVLGELTVPVHFVAGNHDIKPRNLQETVAIYTNHFGPLSERKTYGGVECVFVYTEPLANRFTVSGYNPLAVVEGLLDGCEDRPVILFHHFASVTDYYNEKMHAGWSKSKGGAQWHSLLQKKGVDAVIAGHFHRSEQHWIGEIPVYISSPIADYWGRQASFRIYEYRNGRLSYRTQYIP